MTSRPTPLRRFAASVLAALAVAAIAYGVSLLAFFAASGASTEQLPGLNTIFLPPALLLFVLQAGAIWLGAGRRWYIALAAGLASAVLASLIGTLVPFFSAGGSLTAEVVPALLATLAGISLLFLVSATVAAVFVAPTVYREVAGGGRAAPVALVRPPSSRLAEGELTHLERTPVDAELADSQWDAYVATLEAEGFEIVEVDVADDHPDSVFVEDAVVILGHTAVLTSPGADSRRGEVAGVETAVRARGLDVRSIALPGTLDGGDVLKIDRTIYVGRGGRTNAEGIRQLRAIAHPLGYTVVAVPVTRVLHLKSAVTALPDGTVIGHAPLVEHPEIFPRFLAVPEETGAAVVVLSTDSLLMSAAAPQTAALLADLGYRVVTVDISEYEKLEGCVTCLSVRIRS